jgi:hypothetical protein
MEAIAKGRASPDLSVSRLARNLPMAWKDQDRRPAAGSPALFHPVTLALQAAQEIRRFQKRHWRLWA